VGCKMCNAGFADRTSLFEDYKYLEPEQFNALLPWIEGASIVVLAGMGETLDSPYIEKFLNQVKDKVSIVTTSGVPLNKQKVHRLIAAQLHFLNLSFDGKTSLGHGGGNEKYIQKFWEKVKMIQAEKKTLKVNHPALMLTVAVEMENLCHLEAIFQSALENDITFIDLILMIPDNPSHFQKSVFINFQDAKSKINAAIKTWNAKGMRIRIYEEREVKATHETCYFVGKHLIFNLKRNQPLVCCGPINMPLSTDSFTPDEYWNSFPLRYFRNLHFVADPEDLPKICQDCWVVKPESFSLGEIDTGSATDNRDTTLADYQIASQLKSDGQIQQAENLFHKILTQTEDGEIRGKVYFHLGEMEVQKTAYSKALQFMKLAVRYSFGHRLAFAYLYLLLLKVGDFREDSPKRNMDLQFLNEFAEFSPLTSLPEKGLGPPC
jgi:tetratricopeptide (TPR) repeat protein